MRKVACGWLVVVMGCSGNPLRWGGDGTARGGARLTVHEWGTFTSVSGSDGALLDGLYHEEEALPAFVHSRAQVWVDDAGAKGSESRPQRVTQKLETPVIYFYGDQVREVRVSVDFPQGVVSQWFPQSAEFAPPLGQMTTAAGGHMTWKARLEPGGATNRFPAVAADSVWAPSRQVASVPIEIEGEREQFIFYRGMGDFGLPLSITDAGGELVVRNDSDEPIPSLFLLRVHAPGGAIVEIPSVAAHSERRVTSPAGEKEHDLDQYVATAKQLVAAALVRSGLYDAEARAMVETWSRSYFRSPGLRLLYVVPRAWTDRLLPLAIEADAAGAKLAPASADLVRTLVGRVEILTRSDEDRVLQLVRDGAAQHRAVVDLVAELGRFAEPMLRRVAPRMGYGDELYYYHQNALAYAAELP